MKYDASKRAWKQWKESGGLQFAAFNCYEGGKERCEGVCQAMQGSWSEEEDPEMWSRQRFHSLPYPGKHAYLNSPNQNLMQIVLKAVLNHTFMPSCLVIMTKFLTHYEEIEVWAGWGDLMGCSQNISSMVDTRSWSGCNAASSFLKTFLLYSLNVGVTIPVFKCKGRDPLNPITLTSVIAKCLEIVVLGRLSPILEETCSPTLHKQFTGMTSLVLMLSFQPKKPFSNTSMRVRIQHFAFLTLRKLSIPLSI